MGGFNQVNDFCLRWKKYGELGRDEKISHLLRLLCVDSFSKSSIEVINLQGTWISPNTLQTEPFPIKI